MKRNIRRWFYGTDFIQSATTSIFNNPFWLEDNSGAVVPYPAKDSAQVNECVATFYSHTLPTLGFYNLADGDDLIPIQLVGGIAVEVNHSYIRDYIKYVLSFIDGGDRIIDAMTQRYDRFFGVRILNSLRIQFNKKPLKDKRTSAYRFYENGVVSIDNNEGCKLIPYSDLPEDSFVWANQIINRKFNPDLVSSFNVDEFIEDITDKAGHQFKKWCQNLCKSRDEDTSKWVYNPNKFKTLSTGLGYLLHQKWNEYKCVIFVDEDLQEGRADGRTGKSLVLDDALSYALDSQTVEADQIKKDRSIKFLFHNVTPSTQYICLDDACQDFDFSTLFSKITGPFTCERKYGGIFQFSKQDKPKLGLSSNHPIIGEGSSYIDRQHIVEVGGFYRFHKMELFKDPSEFHDGFLFDSDWSDLNWAEFDAFCVNCLRYYLQVGLIGGRSSGNYRYKKLVSTVGSARLVNTIQRFLQENAGRQTYQKVVKEMSDQEVSLCLDEYVRENLPEEDLTLNALHDALFAVAGHFNIGINRGAKSKRPQKRFGPKKTGVNVYNIADPSNPFKSVSNDGNEGTDPKDSVTDKSDDDFDVVAAFEDLDPVVKAEKQIKKKVAEQSSTKSADKSTVDA